MCFRNALVERSLHTQKAPVEFSCQQRPSVLCICDSFILVSSQMQSYIHLNMLHAVFLQCQFDLTVCKTQHCERHSSQQLRVYVSPLQANDGYIVRGLHGGAKVRIPVGVYVHGVCMRGSKDTSVILIYVVLSRVCAYLCVSVGHII